MLQVPAYAGRDGQTAGPRQTRTSASAAVAAGGWAPQLRQSMRFRPSMLRALQGTRVDP